MRLLTAFLCVFVGVGTLRLEARQDRARFEYPFQLVDTANTRFAAVLSPTGRWAANESPTDASDSDGSMAITLNLWRIPVEQTDTIVELEPAASIQYERPTGFYSVQFAPNDAYLLVQTSTSLRVSELPSLALYR